MSSQSPVGRPPHREGRKVQFDSGDRVMTKQAFKDETDINLVVKRHAQTGVWDHLNTRQPHYGDFTMATDLQTAIERVNAAEDDFMSLPASVRAVCDNDPVGLLQLLSSEEGAQALFDAGLPLEGFPLPSKDEGGQPEDGPTLLAEPTKSAEKAPDQ